MNSLLWKRMNMYCIRSDIIFKVKIGTFYFHILTHFFFVLLKHSNSTLSKILRLDFVSPFSPLDFFSQRWEVSSAASQLTPHWRNWRTLFRLVWFKNFDIWNLINSNKLWPDYNFAIVIFFYSGSIFDCQNYSKYGSEKCLNSLWKWYHYEKMFKVERFKLIVNKVLGWFLFYYHLKIIKK